MITIFRDGDYPPLRRWSEPAQIIGFALFALFLYCITGFLLSLIGIHNYTYRRFENIDIFAIFSYLIIFSLYPFMATAFAQWLPIVLIRWLKKPVNMQILFAAFWFAFFHIKFGPAEVLQKFMAGWVLAACFVFCRKDSWIKAYRVTSLSHALLNLCLFFYFLILRIIY